MPIPRFPAKPLLAPKRLAALLGLVLLAVLAPVAIARAQDFTVTGLQDHGAGSLREAITEANLSQGGDRISFAAALSGTIELESELPEIKGDLEILGPGQKVLTVHRDAGVPGFSVFRIGRFNVSISGLTISGGKAEDGGGIHSEGSLTLTRVTLSGNEATSEGGGIFSITSPLTLRESILSGNVVRETGANGAIALGGGAAIEEGGTILRSTITANTVEASAPTGVVRAEGGGVFMQDGSVDAIEQSTIAANTVKAGGGSSETRAEGGGVVTRGTTISGSTITANSVAAGKTALGANLSGQETTVRDSILSKPQGASNCRGTSDSGGFNIEDGTSCGFTQASDHSDADPGLAPALADNGGPTPTFALLPGSIAIDQGSAFGAGTDQRGTPRPFDFGPIANAPSGDGSDIGAFEVQPPSPKDTKPPQTRILHGPAHKSAARLARFSFSSTEAGSRFECKLDKSAFKRCASPFKHKVKPGKHIFAVRAVDAAGNVDKTPARYVWLVSAHRPR